MRVLHLDCGARGPAGAAMVCHVLLLEVGARLVLVDAGFGTADVRDPRRLGPMGRVLASTLRDEDTAIEQIRALGHDPAAVTDIVLTHGDLDHAGGISDFPAARIHLTAEELVAVRRRRGLRESLRYRPAQWAHRPQVIGHRPGTGHWYGFDRVVDLSQLAPGLLLVPLPGHTSGHAGVALPGEGGWLLHAGDAAHSAASLRPGGTRADVHFRQGLLAHDTASLRRTQRVLSALATDVQDVRVLTAHERVPAEPRIS